MTITEKTYEWNGTLAARRATEYIILHHRAGEGDADSIHKGHIASGWTGIGYHFYVRKDGSVFRGRPQEMVGAHCVGYNLTSVGVCFEGNYQTERTMPPAQLQAGMELVSYLKGLYPCAAVKRHKDFMATVCPGQFFPFEEIAKRAVSVKKELTSANDIT